MCQNMLYLLWKHHSGGVPEQMPYLSRIKLKMKSPSSLQVEVVEREPVACLVQDGNIFFDKDGLILEISDRDRSGIPVVTGIKVGEPVLYQKLPTQSSAQLRTILSVAQLLTYQELQAKEIQFGENTDISVVIGRVKAILGQDEYLEEKIAHLRAILDSMDAKAGTLHMENFTGKNEPVTFSKSNEEDYETEYTEGGSGMIEGIAGAGALGGEFSEEGGSDEGSEAGDSQEDDLNVEIPVPEPEQSSSTTFMVFNSSGTLVYNARVQNGTVVDSNGNAVPGCSINEKGNVVDAYWNEIDPATGSVLNLN